MLHCSLFLIFFAKLLCNRGCYIISQTCVLKDFYYGVQRGSHVTSLSSSQDQRNPHFSSSAQLCDCQANLLFGLLCRGFGLFCRGSFFWGGGTVQAMQSGSVKDNSAETVKADVSASTHDSDRKLNGVDSHSVDQEETRTTEPCSVDKKENVSDSKDDAKNVAVKHEYATATDTNEVKNKVVDSVKSQGAGAHR